MRGGLRMSSRLWVAGMVVSLLLSPAAAWATCNPSPPNCGVCNFAYCVTTDNTWECRPSAYNVACNDNNACTYNDHCDGHGSCVGTPANCSQCQACTGTSSCTNLSSSTSCNDGNACTYGEHCDG